MSCSPPACAPWAALALLAACSSGGGGGVDRDASVEEEAGVSGLCRADPSDDAESAVDLVSGVEARDFVCTPRDADWFRLQVAADTPLARITLRNEAPLTPVTYELSVVDAAGTTLKRVVDEQAGRKPVSVRVVVRLTEPGTYFVVVRDAGGLAVDPNAPYGLTVDLLPDPDGHEPNDSAEQAGPVDGCEEGHLAYAGDEDWWSFDLTGGKLLSVELSLSGESVISPRYEVYAADGSEPLVGGVEAAVHALPGGRYAVRVRDLAGASDLETAYALCVRELDEPDDNERPERNDRPDPGRGSLGDDGQVSGGYIASLGDRDWFSVQALAGTDASHPSLYEVELQLDFQTTPDMEVAFSLVRPHSQTACGVDTDCATLRKGCVRGSDCPGFVCNPERRECAGAGVCLPAGVCGVSVFSSALRAGGLDQTRLFARQPLFEGGEYFLVVQDFQDDEYDAGVRYSLSWRTLPEPDPLEPNGNYAPYPGTDPGGGAGSEKSHHLGAEVTEDVEGLRTITWGCAEGYISYPGDEDWFFFPMPESADTPARTWHLEFEYTDSNSPLKLEYVLSAGAPGAVHLGWFEGGQHPLLGGPILPAGVWGATECAYACYNAPRPFWLRVQEAPPDAGAERSWDAERAYRVCLRATEGCRPSLCPCEAECPEPDAE